MMTYYDLKGDIVLSFNIFWWREAGGWVRENLRPVQIQWNYLTL